MPCGREAGICEKAPTDEGRVLSQMWCRESVVLCVGGWVDPCSCHLQVWKRFACGYFDSVRSLPHNPHQAYPRMRTPRSQHTKNGYHACERHSKWALSKTLTVTHVTVIANGFQPHLRAECHESGCVVHWRTRCGLGVSVRSYMSPTKELPLLRTPLSLSV